MSTPRKSTEEQIIDTLDEIILNKLKNNQTLVPSEQDRVLNIIKNSAQIVPTAPRIKIRYYCT